MALIWLYFTAKAGERATAKIPQIRWQIDRVRGGRCGTGLGGRTGLQPRGGATGTPHPIIQ